MQWCGSVHAIQTPAGETWGMNISIANDTRREARFSPADAALSRTLGRTTVEAFNARGIIGPFTVHEPDEVRRNRAAFDAMLATFRAEGKDSYAINGYHSSCATIWDMATNPRILDLVQDLIGPDIVVWGTHFFCKMPGDGKAVAWHQDATYWPLTPTRTVTAWIAVDDADLGNGGMQVIPGSHLLGALPVRPSMPQDNNILWEQAAGWQRFGTPECIALRAGQCTLHSDLLLHGSEPNRSDRRRCGLTVRYAATEVRSWAGWNEHGILCRGEDRDGHWKHHPRPDGDRPFGAPVMFGSN
jgi:non-heme Fe2+,alpha-ketoglutarate-dependent halogenase